MRIVAEEGIEIDNAQAVVRIRFRLDAPVDAIQRQAIEITPVPHGGQVEVDKIVLTASAPVARAEDFLIWLLDPATAASWTASAQGTDAQVDELRSFINQRLK